MENYLSVVSCKNGNREKSMCSAWNHVCNDDLTRLLAGKYSSSSSIVINSSKNSEITRWLGSCKERQNSILTWLSISYKITQQTNTSSKSTIETLEQGVKYVVFLVYFKHISHLLLAFLMFTLNKKMFAGTVRSNKVYVSLSEKQDLL